MGGGREEARQAATQQRVRWCVVALRASLLPSLDPHLHPQPSGPPLGQHLHHSQNSPLPLGSSWINGGVGMASLNPAQCEERNLNTM